MTFPPTNGYSLRLWIVGQRFCTLSGCCTEYIWLYTERFVWGCCWRIRETGSYVRVMNYVVYELYIILQKFKFNLKVSLDLSCIWFLIAGFHFQHQRMKSEIRPPSLTPWCCWICTLVLCFLVSSWNFLTLFLLFSTFT